MAINNRQDGFHNLSPNKDKYNQGDQTRRLQLHFKLEL